MNIHEKDAKRQQKIARPNTKGIIWVMTCEQVIQLFSLATFMANVTGIQQ
jgi:hypothetical protein